MGGQKRGLLRTIRAAAAAGALGLLTNATQSQDLGRLFTTPQEREMLDALRKQPPPEPKSAEATVLEVVPRITVNGVVGRSRGGNTAWINGANTLHGDLSSQHIEVDTRGIHGSTVPIRLPDARGAVRLRVGQSYDPSGSQLIDAYEHSAAASERGGQVEEHIPGAEKTTERGRNAGSTSE